MPRPEQLATSGLAAFVALLALAHPLRPDLPPTEHFISEYARGWTQVVTVPAFLGWAVATAGCAGCARAWHGRPLARALVVGALAVAVAGTLLAAGFRTQTIAGVLPAGVERTAEGRLHDLGTLLILAGLLSAALASLRLVPDLGYRLAVAAAGLALLAIVPVLVALGLEAPGIGQRAFVLIGCAWQWRFARATARKRIG